MLRLLANSSVIAASLLTTLEVTAQVTVQPTAPVTFDTIRVQIPTGAIGTGAFNSFNTRETLVSMESNRITVSLLLMDSGFAGAPSPALDLPIGQLPPGNYTVEVLRRQPGGGSAPTLGQVNFNVRARQPAEPLWNHSDLWWNPDESGWGLNIMHHGLGKIFATWFVYGPDRAPVWYVIPDGVWLSPTEYRGDIYRTSGPHFGQCQSFLSCAVPFNPSLVTRTLVGSGSLTFNANSADAAAASLTIDGVTYARLIRRQSF